MNVQARKSVCHGKHCIAGQKSYNINVFSFRIRNFVTPIIESVRTPARITPYPTGRLFGWRYPRHFVPGYDRTVPPGHFATGSSVLSPKYEVFYCDQNGPPARRSEPDWRRGSISEPIRDRRGTQPPAHFHRNPPGGGRLALFPRCSLD